MKNKSIFKKVLAFSFSLVLMSNTVVFAAESFTDVSTADIAYSSISNMVEKGYMTKSDAGEFKPTNPIDKFETAKVLAKVAGFKESGATPSEQATYDTAYTKHKAKTDSYKNTYLKWNSSSDKEIAFLLEKGIFEETDLNQFVVKNGDKENLRALSKQEAAMFVVKVIDKKQQALTSTASTLFADDGKINQGFKPYIYYLKGIGVISSDSSNNFSPNSAITRAELAIMLDKALNLDGSGSAVTAGEVLKGSIEKVHISLNSLQVKLENGESRLYKMDLSATIQIDGASKTLQELKDNMQVTITIKDGLIVDVKAQTTKTAEQAPVEPPTAVVAPPSTNIAESEYKTVIGTIKEVNGLSADSKTIGIEVRILNPTGGIITEKDMYVVDSQSKITRGGNATDINNIAMNDIVTAKVYGGKAYTVDLAEKNRKFTGTVVDKKVDIDLGTSYYEVKDGGGKINELTIDGNSKLTRKGINTTVGFDDIRIGDTVDISAEYAVIKEAYAYGNKSHVEGMIKEIHITKNGNYIVLSDYDGRVEKYNVIKGRFDIYTLKVNQVVKLQLDSKEIEGVTLIKDTEATDYTGYVSEVTQDYIELRPSMAAYTNVVKIYYNSNTRIINITKGTTIKATDISKDMKVYITYSDVKNKTADTIIILDN